MGLSATVLIMAGTFFGVGLILVIVGFWQRRRCKGWWHARGVITGYNGDVRGAVGFFTTFVFQDQYGQWRIHHWLRAGNALPWFLRGTQVDVLFDPADPGRAVVNTAFKTGTGFLVLGSVIAVPALLIGAWAYLIAANIESAVG